MNDVWIALITAAGAIVVARIGLVVARLQVRAQEARDLDEALIAYQASVVKAVAALTRMPDVDPDHPFHKLSDVLERGKRTVLGPTVSFVQSEKRIRQTLGPEPFAPVERVVDAAVRLQILGAGPEVDEVIDRINDYFLELSNRRTQEVLDKWPQLHKQLQDAVHAARAHVRQQGLVRLLYNRRERAKSESLDHSDRVGGAPDEGIEGDCELPLAEGEQRRLELKASVQSSGG